MPGIKFKFNMPYYFRKLLYLSKFQFLISKMGLKYFSKRYLTELNAIMFINLSNKYKHMKISRRANCSYY